jgi:hypothetical protein
MHTQPRTGPDWRFPRPRTMANRKLIETLALRIRAPLDRGVESCSSKPLPRAHLHAITAQTGGHGDAPPWLAMSLVSVVSVYYSQSPLVHPARLSSSSGVFLGSLVSTMQYHQCPL